MCLEVKNDHQKSSRLKGLSMAILVLGRIVVFCFCRCFRIPPESLEPSRCEKSFLIFWEPGGMLLRKVLKMESFSAFPPGGRVLIW